MRYGFLDESGDVAYTSEAGNNLVVVVVVVEHPKRLQALVKKTRRSFGRRLRDAPELKAAQNVPGVTRKLLVRAVESGFDAVAVVIDKRTFPRPQDPEDLYRYACTRAVREALNRFGSLSLTLDRRYTTLRLQRQLDRALDACLEGLSGKMLAPHYDSPFALCWGHYPEFWNGTS